MKQLLFTIVFCLCGAVGLHAQAIFEASAEEIKKNPSPASGTVTNKEKGGLIIIKGVKKDAVKVYKKENPGDKAAAEEVGGVLQYNVAEKYFGSGAPAQVIVVIEIGSVKKEVAVTDKRSEVVVKKEDRDLLKLFKEMKGYKAPPHLADLLSSLGDCCCEDIVPCIKDACDKHGEVDIDACCKDKKPVINGSERDPARFRRNRIVYSVYPQYSYTYNQRGKIRQGWFRGNPLRVTAGYPVTLEIRNFNRDLFTVTATPSTTSYNVDIPNLLSLLTTPSMTNIMGDEGEEQPATALTPTEKARVAAVLALEQMSAFLNLLDNSSCINISNQYAEYKKQARAAVDNWFGNILNGGTSANALAFTAGQLDINKVDSDLYKAFKKAYERLESRQFRYVINLPTVDGQADKIIYKLDIKNAKDGLPYIVPNQELVAYTVGGFKIDFSSGIYYAGFRDPRFSIRRDSTVVKGFKGNDSTVIDRRAALTNEGERVGEFGFSSFIHFYPKMSPGFSLGGSIGAGLTFTEGKEKAVVRYFGGISALIGTQNRIAVTAGAAMGFVNELSKQYTQTAGVYDALPFSATDVSYVRKFQAKGFVSFTYNLPIGKGNDTKKVDVPVAPAKAADPSAAKSDTKSPAQ